MDCHENNIKMMITGASALAKRAIDNTINLTLKFLITIITY